MYLDGKLVHQQTPAAKKRSLLPLDFPFRVDLKELVRTQNGVLARSFYNRDEGELSPIGW